jgi:hypothetical protein
MTDAVEFEVRHTEAGVRRATRALWNARHRKSMWTSFAVAVVAMTVALVTRDLPWYLAIVLTAAILHAAFLGWHRDHVLKLASSELARAQPPVFRYRFDDAGFAETSPVGKVELPWSSFAALRAADGYLYLLRSPLSSGLFVALPVDQVPEATQTLLRERLPPG